LHGTFVLVAVCMCYFQDIGFHASLVRLDQRGLEDLEHKTAIKK